MGSYEDTGTLTIRAESSSGHFLMFMVLSMFGSGFITNPVSEMEFFPSEYVFYISLFGILFLTILIILSIIWGRLNKQWTLITLDGDEIYLQRYLPFKVSSFSHKQIKSVIVDVVIMEKVYVETKNNDNDDDYHHGREDGYWDYRVELMDENNNKLAYFSLKNDEWEPFAVSLSERLNKKLIKEI